MKHMKKRILLTAAITLICVLTGCTRLSVARTSTSVTTSDVQPTAAPAPVQPEPTTAPAPVQAEPTAVPVPERTVSYTILLGGKDTTVYLEVSDEEITLWDSASGGQLLAVAKYAQPLSGAAEAQLSCDFTDLDEDGNSDLTANFTFEDGSTASLVWFYAEVGFVYNEEFSVLPGDAPAGDG